MSETNQRDEEELPEGKDDAVEGYPPHQELQGGGTDEEREREQQSPEDLVEENIRAELDDRILHHGEDHL